MKKIESTKKIYDETKEDEAALRLIDELGLKNNQHIREDDLYTIVKALYPKEYQTKLETLLNSKYLQAYYIVDLRT